MKKYRFYIVGGDTRSLHLAKSLQEKGHYVKTALLDENEHEVDLTVLKLSDVLLLPIPCCDVKGDIKTTFCNEKISLSKLLEQMDTATVLMGGMIPEDIKNRAQTLGMPIYDYYEREEFTVRNAALTAEAAVSLAMEMLKESISGVPVLVMGHGRIGRLLSGILKALDADVTVAARRYSDLAWIRSEGMTPLEFRLADEKIGKFKIIFNTVPSPVLNKERLMLVNKESIIIDLASSPGGTDFEEAKALGISAKNALGLPGKFAPKTAGEIICDTVLNILSERENEHGK